MPLRRYLFLMTAFFFTIGYATGYAQNVPVIKANSTKADIREDGKLTKGAWVISPAEKKDIYPTSGKRVTFYTDIDSISFAVDPAVGTYDFVILVNGKDSAHTQVKYDAGYRQPQPPSAADIRRVIEGQIYSFKIPKVEIFKMEDRVVMNGKDSIRVRIYYPAAGKSKRVIYNIHGGALIACDLETHDNISRILANKTGAIVVALDYRKPPEYPYPAGLDDCGVVLNWIKANAVSFGGDPKNLVLLGDSGGGLFIACLEVRWREKIGARAVVLINPATDLRNYDQGPYGYVTKMYLGDHDANDSLVSPLAARDFSYFPPTLIITSEKDPLRSQGVDFFKKLSAAGVNAKTVDMPGLGHLGGFWAAGHPKADSAIAETVNFLGTAP